MQKNIGLIGFGVMGYQIAMKLIEEKCNLSTFDINPEATARAEELGCEVYNSPALVAQRTNIILISLPSPKHVAEVVCDDVIGLLSGAASGSVIIDTSTVDPTTSQTMANKASRFEVGYLDAPVLGRPMSVGKWTLPVGGNSNDIEKARGVLSLLAERIVHVGPVGGGNKLKLLNNLMFGAINSITCEVFALCKHLEMDPKVFFETVSKSTAGTVSNLFKELGPKIINKDFSADFSINNLNKDIQLGIDMAKSVGVKLPISENNQVYNVLGKNADIGQEDTAALVKIFEKLIASEGSE